MEPFAWLNDFSRQFLAHDYLLPGRSAEQRLWQAALSAEGTLRKKNFARRFYDNLERGWYSLSTPVWTNFGTDRGLGASCFGSKLEDTMDSIVEMYAESVIFTKNGGGTSCDFSSLRGRGAPIKDKGDSNGAVHFMRLPDNMVDVVSQGRVRRGNYAAYLDADHPDFEEFLTARSEGSPLQNLSTGAIVTDAFMQKMLDRRPRECRLWAKLLESRRNTGYPYVFFVDVANRHAPDVYRAEGTKIHHSNLCSEICLSDGPTESFVCFLSSMNVLYYDEWKDTDAVELLVYFLDAVVSQFVERAKEMKYMERAVRFSERQRALGIGWIGWHSHLQSKMIPFESMEAKLLGVQIARTINEQAHAASAKMAKEYGEPDLLGGSRSWSSLFSFSRKKTRYGRRHVTLTAIAPTKSSSFIHGQVSAGVEPERSNYDLKDLQKGKFTTRNRYLEKTLARYDKDHDGTWESILTHKGSVAHLDFLSENEKDVFRVMHEIPARELVVQAAGRQRHVDQSQSLNLWVHPLTPARQVNALLTEAWRLGVKSLYYQLGVNATLELTTQINACKSCDG